LIPLLTIVLLLAAGRRTVAADDIVIADFEGKDYQGWTATGDAFGSAPAQGTLAGQREVSGYLGHGLVNTYLHGDQPQGTLTSPPFAIQRKFINFLIGGGAHPGTTCINLLVDNKIVRTATGADDEHLDWATWNVVEFKGKQAQLEIVDRESGRWGHVNVDQIVQSDAPKFVAQPIYQEPFRPQFHFTADKNWLNDPNGLVFFGGEYHLFFQRDPNTLGGEHKSWGHAVSADLVHWEQLADALSPDARGDVWSGSAVVDWNNTAGFETGKEPPLIAMFTAAGNPFSQCIAFSNDRGRTWTHYDKNPVIPHVIGGDRDPRLVWDAPLKQWIVALYLDKSTYAFFSSPDLKNWTHLQDIDVPGCGECPDFFPMTVTGERTEKWVFTAANGRYLVGSFDGKQFSPEQELRRVDFGANYYAVQSYGDIPSSDGRRIQIAWMAGGRYPRMPFNQQMSFPAEMTLHRTPDGMRIRRVPVKEIETLHGEPLSFSNLALAPGDDPLSAIKGDLFDIRAEIDLQQAREITFGIRGQKVTYSAKDQKLSCVGSAPLQLHDGRLSLQILVDRTSIETFANDGEVSITDCFLPAANQPDLDLRVTGGNAQIISLKVFKLHSAWKTAR
jgi:sucrose-6-phosphate hydrolase SacC (GH32 family)